MDLCVDTLSTVLLFLKITDIINYITTNKKNIKFFTNNDFWKIHYFSHNPELKRFESNNWFLECKKLYNIDHLKFEHSMFIIPPQTYKITRKKFKNYQLFLISMEFMSRISLYFLEDIENIVVICMITN